MSLTNLSFFYFIKTTPKKLIVLAIGFIFTIQLPAQKISYSDLENNDINNTSFQIIGIIDEDILIYEFSDKKHQIYRYNQEMQKVGQVNFTFLPDKTDRIQFVKSRNDLMVFYQYVNNNILFCKKANYNNTEKIFKDVVTIDSVNKKGIGNNNFYTISISENKKTFLLSFIKSDKDSSYISTAIFDAKFNKIRQKIHGIYREQKNQVLSNLYVDNIGNYFFATQSKINSENKFNKLNLFIYQIDDDSVINIVCDIKNKLLQNILLKIDNLNKNILVNAYYLSDKDEMVEGLYTCVFNWQDVYHPRQRFNPFSDDIKSTLKNNRQGYFDNIVPREIILKNDGGFSLIAEDCYTETQNLNNSWDRNYRNNFTGSGIYDYNNSYLFSNRYYDNFTSPTRIKYYYNDILVMSIDSSLTVDWKSFVRKKQYAEQTEKYLSYCYFNAGNEIAFLHIEKDNQRYILSHNGISSTGINNLYPAIRSHEENYQFAPRYGKQVSWNQVVVPYTYLNKMGFAHLLF